MSDPAQPPSNLQQVFQLAVARLNAGQWAEAETIFRRLLSVQPNIPEIHHNLGVALLHQKKQEEALILFRRAVILRPDFADAWNNIGIALDQLNRDDLAVAAYRQALKLRPDWAQTWCYLGAVLLRLNSRDEGIKALRQAVALQPSLGEAWLHLGAVLRQTGQPAQAAEAFQHAVKCRPNDVLAWNSLGDALREANRFEQAVSAFQKALALQHDLPEAWNNLGITYQQMRQPNEAVNAYRRALMLRPNFPEAWVNLGHTLVRAIDLSEAIDAYRRALAIQGDSAIAWTGLGGAFKDAAQLEEAVACFDRALAIQPDLTPVQDSRLSALNYHRGFDAGAIFREVHKWNQSFARPLRAALPAHDNVPDPNRRLRIGYISPDFRRHCESVFMLPLLSHHDHQAFEIFCYSATGEPDPITARHQRHADIWREIATLNDQNVAQLIHQDKIDILMDLTLHLGGNRLAVFAQKPAPIQVTWLGYPGTTGLDTIDYRISDPRLDPVEMDEPSASDSQDKRIGASIPCYSERTVRLPDTFWCFDPRGTDEIPEDDALDPGPLPALAAGHVTFGSLNNFCKVNDGVLELWSKVMAALPAAQLLMVAPLHPFRQHVVKKLQVTPDRLQFLTYQPRLEYLRTYRRVDLFLDTLPFNGGTTSLDALWMGVPVLTRLGDRVVGRAGSSLLHHVGLSELVARSDQEYVQRAVEWAGDLDRLSRLRATLRQTMESSPLMDGQRFARNMEAAYRQMWQAWCASRV